MGSKASRTKEEVAQYIEDFLLGKGGDWDCDDFISIRIKNSPELESIRQKCGQLPDLYPAIDRDSIAMTKA